MYPNRLRSGTLNLVLFRSCAVVQCGHIVVSRSRKKLSFYLDCAFINFFYTLTLIFLCPVSPKTVQLTTTSSAVYHGDVLIATCCASGYPEPIIKINGKTLPKTTSNFTNGVYKQCVSGVLDTSSTTPGSNLTINCNVSLSQTVMCTKTAPSPVVNNCQRALSTSVGLDITKLIKGMYMTPVC